MRENIYHKIQAILNQAIQDQVSPSIAFYVGKTTGQQRYFIEGSHFPYDLKSPPPPRTSLHSYFDLASLTKPIHTTTRALSLLSQNKLSLSTPIGDIITNLEDPILAKTPFFRLLNHSSGLAAHFPYYQGMNHLRMNQVYPLSHYRAQIRKMIHRTSCAYTPGERGVYSDLGYLLLEEICSVLDQCTIDDDFQKNLSIYGFKSNPLPQDCTTLKDQHLFVPTELCPWRNRRLTGEVHDDNAWLMGGLCGHAGLFGSITHCREWAMAWLKSLRKALGYQDQLASDQSLITTISDEIFQQILHPQYRVPDHSFALGWDKPSINGYSSAGQRFSYQSIGHLGFTGTSIWMDIEKGMLMILLSNRVYFGRDNLKLRPLRPILHDLAWDLFEDD
jgi:CubicO group peptidase (beta-lactamase class C family)